MSLIRCKPLEGFENHPQNFTKKYLKYLELIVDEKDKGGEYLG